MQSAWLSHFYRNAPDHRSRDEGGYLLVGVAVLMLIVVGVLGSYAFVQKRSGAYSANYAAGIRFADLAVMAHNFAQERYYQTPSLNLDGAGNLNDPANMNYINPPDGMGFGKINGTDFTIDIRARNSAPVNITASYPAPSAYMHLAFRGKPRSATDNVTFLAGATSHGMNRVGIVDSNAIKPTTTCDNVINNPADPIRVMWGAEQTSCLTNAQLAAIGFNVANIQPGDIIVPVWETALARSNKKVVFRYPQPERPDVNTMEANLLMNGNDIRNDATNPSSNYRIQTNDLNSSGTAIIEDMTVRQGSATNIGTMNTAATAPLQIYDQTIADPSTTTVMNVTGPVVITNVDLNVAGNLNSGGGPGGLNVTVPDNGDPMIPDTVVAVNHVGDASAPIAMTIDLVGGDLSPTVNVAAMNPASNITDLSVTGPTGRLNVTQTFDTGGNTMQGVAGGNMNVYSALVRTANTGNTVVNNSNGGALDWDVGAIDQRGVTGAFHVHTLRVDIDCMGRACPDNVTDPGGGGGF